MSDQPGNFDPRLSASGERRKGEILRLALAAGNRRKRTRRAGMMALLVIALIVPAALVFRNRAMHSTGELAVRIPVPANTRPTPGVTPSIPQSAAAPIVYLQADPNILSRLTIAPPSPNWQRLSDDELLTRLSELGKPGAIAIVDGKPTLVLLNSHEVIDGG